MIAEKKKNVRNKKAAQKISRIVYTPMRRKKKSGNTRRQHGRNSVVTLKKKNEKKAEKRPLRDVCYQVPRWELSSAHTEQTRPQPNSLSCTNHKQAAAAAEKEKRQKRRTSVRCT